MGDDISELIESITCIKSSGQFDKYINYIHFPHFKNLEQNTRIHFYFPLTAFIGQNGCGKSSVLHALFGAIAYNNINRFWFSTEIDPIKERIDGHRHCYYYEYTEGGNEFELLNTRIKREDPDTWETSRRVLEYGMRDERRSKPVRRPSIYLDFRKELGAFDKFYFVCIMVPVYCREKIC